MIIWKGLWWTLWLAFILLDCTEACLEKEQFLAGLDPKLTLVFEAELLQFGESDETEAYVRTTKIIRQPETGWQLRPGNIAYLTGIQPRVTDTLDCLPRKARGRVYLWITRNTAVTMRNTGYSLELVPGGLFDSNEYLIEPTAHLTDKKHTRLAQKANTFSAQELDSFELKDRQNNGPCLNVQCSFGAVCETWPSPGTDQPVGVCVCPQLDALNHRGLCNIRSGPICAHNGRLYDNECDVVLAICVQQSHLGRIELPAGAEPTNKLCEQLATDRSQAEKIDHAKSSAAQHSDKADKMPKDRAFEEKPQQDAADPYHEDRMSLYAQPMGLLDTDLGCEMFSCPNTLSPVCGTDEVTYLNECLLRQRSCFATRSGRPAIRINHHSHCDHKKASSLSANLCEGNNVCMYGGLCPTHETKATKSSTAWFGRCTCDHISCLHHGSDPVCADDGQTYSNECFLQRRVCETQTARQVIYRGNCASNPCLGYTCRWAGERCQVDETGQPKCVCPPPCPNVVSPVCGSDHVTYDSHCHLERTACMKMREIFILYAGQCSEEPHCRSLGLQCQGYEICSRVATSLVHNPFGSYPISWPNLASGSAQGPFVARCLCPSCPEKGIGGHVCGTDGETYRSECHLRASACQRQIHLLKVKARGPCDACKTKDCPYHAICRLNQFGEPVCICPTDCLYVRAPVCGTDGKMYENECFLKVAACAEQREIHVAQEGPCATCPFGCPLGYQCLKGECVCRDACPKSTTLEAEVCGSDGQLYPSECELKRQACLRHIHVRVDPSGAKCRDFANRLQNSKVVDVTKKDEIDADITYLARPQADETIQSNCSCNKIGALSEHCDHKGRCHCKWGVQGDRCDQCMPNYWGIQNGHECIACSCHPDGAFSTICDPLTGQCNCRPGIFGHQCSICPEGGRLTKAGCITNSNASGVGEEDSVIVKEPISQNTDDHDGLLNGRRFTPETTLLVRAPFALKDPFSVQLVFQAIAKNGTLLHYQLAPSKQEQMLLENPNGRQFFLAIVNGHIALRYVSDGPSGRTLSVRSLQPLQLGLRHTLRAGVTHGQPWIKLDTDPQTTVVDIEQRKNENILSNGLSTGGHGTIVLGRHVITTNPSYTPDAAKQTIGFSGCLLQVLLQTDSPPRIQNVDLISGDRTELAWLGVDRLPSGLSEAPLCRATGISALTHEHQYKQPVQSDTKPNGIRVGNPCDAQPCLNGGSCQPESSMDYECICSPGWQGQHCDQMATIIPHFHGDSFIRLPGPNGRQAMNRKRLHIEILFLLTDYEGQILLIPPNMRFIEPDIGPFVSINVDSNGYVVVLCRFGQMSSDRNQPVSEQNQLVTIRYSIPVQLNQWHSLIVDKRTRTMIIQIDQGPKQRVRTVPANFRSLPRTMRKQMTAFDLSESPIYVGGFNPSDRHLLRAIVRGGMKGALQKLNINGAEVVLAGPVPLGETPTRSATPMDSTELWVKVTQWQGPPCGPKYSPCPLNKPESVCRPQGPSAVCACSTPLQLWHLLREKKSSVEDAEQMACEQRRAELERLDNPMLLDKPELNDRMSEHVQHDASSAGLVKHRDVQPSELIGSTTERCGMLPIAFGGQTSMTFLGLIEDVEEYNLRLRLSTKTTDGLILIVATPSGDANERDRQSFTSDLPEITIIELRQGFIEYTIHAFFPSYETGTDKSDFADRTKQHERRTVLHIRSSRKLNDGLCHTIHIARSLTRATLITDHHMISGNFQGMHRNYNPNNVVYLGGLSVNVTGVYSGYRNFTGCIGDVFVNEHDVQLLTSASELRGPVEPCH